MIKTISRIASILFSPFIVPTYAIAMVLWMTILFVVPLETKLTVTAITFLLTMGLPLLVILGLYRAKTIHSMGLENRKERLIPYLVAVLCYALLAVYYHKIHSPIWLTMFPIGGGLAVLVTLIVNRWWKISAHSAAMGGFAAFVYLLHHSQVLLFGGMPMLYFAVIVTGILGTARIFLGLHSPLQVLAGIANGVLCILLTSLFY